MKASCDQKLRSPESRESGGLGIAGYAWPLPDWDTARFDPHPHQTGKPTTACLNNNNASHGNNAANDDSAANDSEARADNYFVDMNTAAKEPEEKQRRQE